LFANFHRARLLTPLASTGEEVVELVKRMIRKVAVRVGNGIPSGKPTFTFFILMSKGFMR
jgi:hypothetical protein